MCKREGGGESRREKRGGGKRRKEVRRGETFRETVTQNFSNPLIDAKQTQAT